MLERSFRSLKPERRPDGGRAQCRRRAALCCLIGLFVLLPARAQTYDCVQIRTPVTIDGSFDEAAWEGAHWIQLKRNDGQPTRMSARAALIWDLENLYVAYDFQDLNILSTITTRDARVWIQDVAELFLTPLESHRVYYEFQFNPLENWRDVVILHQGASARIQPLAEWNSGARLGAAVRGTLDNNQDRDQGWSLEVALPFADFWLAEQLPPQPGDRWRANLFRIDYGLEKPELAAWNPTLGPSFHVPAKFGTLRFVSSSAEGP